MFDSDWGSSLILGKKSRLSDEFLHENSFPHQLASGKPCLWYVEESSLSSRCPYPAPRHHATTMQCVRPQCEDIHVSNLLSARTSHASKAEPLRGPFGGQRPDGPTLRAGSDPAAQVITPSPVPTQTVRADAPRGSAELGGREGRTERPTWAGRKRGVIGVLRPSRILSKEPSRGGSEPELDY